MRPLGRFFFHLFVPIPGIADRPREPDGRANRCDARSQSVFYPVVQGSRLEDRGRRVRGMSQQQESRANLTVSVRPSLVGQVLSPKSCQPPRPAKYPPQRHTGGGERESGMMNYRLYALLAKPAASGRITLRLRRLLALRAAANRATSLTQAPRLQS